MADGIMQEYSPQPMSKSTDFGGVRELLFYLTQLDSGSAPGGGRSGGCGFWVGRAHARNCIQTCPHLVRQRPRDFPAKMAVATHAFLRYHMIHIQHGNEVVSVCLPYGASAHW